MGFLLQFTELGYILHSELKVLAEIQLGVICTHDHIVDFHWPSHDYANVCMYVASEISVIRHLDNPEYYYVHIIWLSLSAISVWTTSV